MVLEVIGIVLAALILTTAVILLLPVRLFLYFGENEGFSLLCRVLCFTFGKEASAQESLQEWFLSLIRRDKKDGDKKAEHQKKKPRLSLSPEELLGVIGSFFRQLGRLTKHCRVTRFHLQIVCADEDAADAAINYGRTCAMVYPAYEYIKSIIHISESGEHLSIRCDFTKEKTTVVLDTVVSVRVAHIVASALRLGKDFITLKMNG